MFTVYFGIAKFAEFDNDVNACAVALDLHRISNVPHDVRVVDSSNGHIIVSLISVVKDAE